MEFPSSDDFKIKKELGVKESSFDNEMECNNNADIKLERKSSDEDSLPRIEESYDTIDKFGNQRKHKNEKSSINEMINGVLHNDDMDSDEEVRKNMPELKDDIDVD